MRKKTTDYGIQYMLLFQTLMIAKSASELRRPASLCPSPSILCPSQPLLITRSCFHFFPSFVFHFYFFVSFVSEQDFHRCWRRDLTSTKYKLLRKRLIILRVQPFQFPITCVTNVYRRGMGRKKQATLPAPQKRNKKPE